MRATIEEPVKFNTLLEWKDILIKALKIPYLCENCKQGMEQQIASIDKNIRKLTE